MKRRVFLPVLLLISLSLAANLRSSDQLEAASIEKDVDRLLAPLAAQQLVSGAVLIARKGEILLAKGYGLANREHDVPNTPETVFSLASITKSFTALAIMKLAERGSLDIDDTVAKYLPDFPAGDRIKLHHLLTHTSGIRSWVFLDGSGEKDRLPLSIEETIEWFKDEPLEFEPGERFSYSNSGYTLLTHVIQKVSGMSYADYLQEHVFDPAGMTHSGVSSYTRLIRGRATGHSLDGCTGTITRAAFREPSFDPGSGSLYSTVFDLHRLDRALRQGRILKRRTQQRMLEPRVDSPWGHRYAYGWFVGESHGRKVAHHEGGTGGFMASFRRFPEDDILVVALFNQDLIVASELFSRLDAIALGKPWRPLFRSTPEESEALACFAGTYRMEADGQLIVENESGRLFIQETGCRRFEVWPLSKTRGFAPRANALLVFSQEENGRARLRAQYGVMRWMGERISP